MKVKAVSRTGQFKHVWPVLHVVSYNVYVNEFLLDLYNAVLELAILCLSLQVITNIASNGRAYN